MTTREYLRALRAALRRRGVSSPAVIRELANHLRDAMDEELAGGRDLAGAEAAATRRFGPVDSVADRLAAEIQSREGSSMSTQPASADRSRRPRGPGVVYAALALALLVLVATFALTARQQPPPTIAEFAPQAVENIIDAPTEQSSHSGGGGTGGGGGSVAADSITEEAAALTVPRAHRCIGDPPRQIEDPQSPPCVPYWEGDNGGATSKGVTRDEIRIAQPTTDAPYTITAQLAQFFNKRFEFYGRKMNVLPESSNAGSGDPVTQRSEAVAADSQNVFASLYYRTSDGLPYRQELARRKVISMGIYWPVEHDQLERSRPYMWQYHQEVDRTFDGMGRWLCRRLAGRNAVHAGGDLAAKPRVFGNILQVAFQEDETDSAALESRMMSDCGVKPAISRRNPVAGGTLPVEPVSATNTMIAFKDKNVTSVICNCNFFAFGALGSAAQSQTYFPEWLTSYSMELNGHFTLAASPDTQRSRTFGIVVIPRQVLVEREPYWLALKEVNPSATDDNGEVSYGYRMEEYRNMLLYASGIQMAGPHLTPETFEAGLQRTRFPNPEHPLMAGAVGFPGRAHGMTTDYAEYYWSTTTVGPYQGEDHGAMCYVDGGRRHTAETLGADGADPFFTGPCDDF